MKRSSLRLVLLFALPVAVLGLAPAQAATKISSCPVNITAPGTYQVTADLSCNGTAITILASNVDLHLGGHTLTGDGSGIGILVQGQANVSIHHGSVRNFRRGVMLTGTLNSSVNRLTVGQNPDLGIDAEKGAAGISVTDNTVSQNGQAIQLALGAHGCTMARNPAYQNFSGFPSPMLFTGTPW